MHLNTILNPKRELIGLKKKLMLLSRHGTWDYARKYLQALVVFERRMLRTVFDGGQANDV